MAAPRLIEEVVEVKVAAPPLAVIAAEVDNAPFALSVTVVAAVTVAETVIEEPVEVRFTFPLLELIAAPEFVIAPDPLIATLPLAWIAAVGATEVPPLIVTVPLLAVSAPPPEYAPVGLMLIDP